MRLPPGPRLPRASSGRAALCAIAAALLCFAAPRNAAAQITDYKCWDYVAEFIVGKPTRGIGLAGLTTALSDAGYTMAPVGPLKGMSPTAAPGDVIIIGTAHAAIFVTPTLLNHYFGETDFDIAQHTWTVADFAAFTRTRDPVTGKAIPPIRPYASLPVELWHRDAGPVVPLPRIVSERRCPNWNPQSGLQCRDVAGHAGDHHDWSQQIWPASAGDRPRTPPAAGTQAASDAAARITFLLQTARVYVEARRYGAAADALEEATRLAGGRFERGQPGGPDSDRVLRGVVELRAALAREAEALVREAARTGDVAEAELATLVEIRLVAQSALGEPDAASAVSGARQRVDHVDEELREPSDLVEPGSRPLQPLVADVRAAADAVCAAQDLVSGRNAWDAARSDRESLLRSEMASRLWAATRQNPGDTVSVDAVATLRNQIEELERRFTSDNADLASRLKENRATVDRMAGRIDEAGRRVSELRGQVDDLAAVHARTDALGSFGERARDRWTGAAYEAGSGLRRVEEEAGRARNAIDRALADGTFSGAAMERQGLAAQKARLEALEGRLRQRDALAAAVLTAEAEMQKDVQRAERCLRTLAQRPSSQPGQPPQAPPAPPSQPPAPQPTPATTQQQPPAPASGGGQPTVQPRKPPAPQPAAPTVQQPVPPANVPVSPPPADPNTAGGIRIVSATTKIIVGQRVQFVATDYGNRPYTSDVTWISLREDFLTIDGQGWATGLQHGKLSIVARYGDDMSAAIEVEVVEAPPGAPAQATVAAPRTGVGASGAGAAAAPGSGGFRVVSGSTRPDSSPDPASDPAPVQPAPTGGFKVVGGSTRPDPPAGQAEQGASADPSAFTMNAPDAEAPPAVPRGSSAWHIFATGSRLGWAGGLARYSVGPADASIIRHLQVAGEHAMWANRESFPPRLAWPGWANMRESFRSWAGNLQRDPSNSVRRQISIDASGNVSGYAQALNFQTAGTGESRANCESVYVQLGFQLAYGAQVMQIADEAARNGDRYAAKEPRADAMSHLNAANSLLIQYEQVILASGVRADLRDVRVLLQRLFALNVNDASAPASTATAAWELANERIAATAGTAPGVRRAEPDSPSPQHATLPAPAPAASPATAPQPGEPIDLSGEWVLCLYTGDVNAGLPSRIGGPPAVAALARGERVIGYETYLARQVESIRSETRRSLRYRVTFTRSGDEYTGVLTPESRRDHFVDPWNGNGPIPRYPVSTQLLRLTRTGPATFVGEFWTARYNGAPAPRWMPTTVHFEGPFLVQEGQEGAVFSLGLASLGRSAHHRLVWMRAPDR